MSSREPDGSEPLHEPLHFDDDLPTATRKCRALIEQLRSESSFLALGAFLAREPPSLGRRPSIWHVAVFMDAMKRYATVGTFRRALDQAVAERIARSETDARLLKSVDAESLRRMFRDWRKRTDGGTLPERLNSTEDFWLAVLNEEPEQAARTFIYLSLESKTEISTKSAILGIGAAGF